MSELMKAKQRLLMRSNSIKQPVQQGTQIKMFTRNGNAASIPKLHKKLRERTSSQIELQDNLSAYRNNDDSPSPGFAKTQRYPLFKRHDNFDIKSQTPEQTSHFRKKDNFRRGTQYSQHGQQWNGIPDISFTENQRSVYNESPHKTVKNTVHNEKLNIIISKFPVRKSISPFKPKQCDLEYLQQFISSNKSNNKLFEDDMFPPRFTIIFNKKYMYVEEGLKLQRVTSIYRSSQVRLLKFCEPTLMVPGKFTSPALYSALAILSEDPTRVLNILGNQEYNQTGIYYVQLNKDGVWRYVLVDDYLPVKIVAKRALLFLHGLQKSNVVEFWPSIIQKALAKIYGTYQDIFLTANKGVKNLFRNLTGYPVSQYAINKDFRTFLIVIDTAIKKKQIVVLEQISQQLRSTAHVKGIEADQSYQIIQVKKTYIVLRNLADKDLVTKLTFEQAMIFARLLIFRSENNYAYISKTMRHKKKCYSILKVTLTESIKCYWDIWENSEIYYKKHIGSNVDYQKSKYCIQIKQVAQSPQQQQKQQSIRESKVYDSAIQDEILTQSGKEVSMGPGTYHLIIHLCQKKEQDFVISFYGQKNIQQSIQRIKNMEKWENQCNCL